MLSTTQTPSPQSSPSPRGAFPENGSSGMNEFFAFLSKIASHPELHSRWINTLSYLEYIGSRKILKSQRAESITAEVLAHTAEEIRHAQTFKKIALKMGRGEVSTYAPEHLFCGSEATLYFQTLDQKGAHALKEVNPWTCYLITTLLIEERANLIYPIYEEILAAQGFPGYLKAIVREENSHLKDIEELIRENPALSPELIQQLRGIEEEAFAHFTRSLSETLSEKLREKTQ